VRASWRVVEVVYGGERSVIERRGKPLAALVRVDDLGRLEEQGPASRPRRPSFSPAPGARSRRGKASSPTSMPNAQKTLA